VTTILAATQSQEKRDSLQRWKDRVGSDAADQIKNEAANRGTAMHAYLEDHLSGKQRIDLTPIGQEARTMAQMIVDQGLKDLNEIWGSEVTVHYPGLYAGATDVAGIYNSAESIIDFKQSNKPKRREWISDYFTQLGAYAMAHNHVYGTKINQGVILMCTKDNLFQKFIVDGQEFVRCQHDFLRKVDQYYANSGNNVS
jgi:genome maintenance exonuclease 1